MKDLKQKEQRYCGECLFFSDEDIGGTGICEAHKTLLLATCSDKACVWFKERKNEKH